MLILLLFSLPGCTKYKANPLKAQSQRHLIFLSVTRRLAPSTAGKRKTRPADLPLRLHLGWITPPASACSTFSQRTCGLRRKVECARWWMSQTRNIMIITLPCHLSAANLTQFAPRSCAETLRGLRGTGVMLHCNRHAAITHPDKTIRRCVNGEHPHTEAHHRHYIALLNWLGKSVRGICGYAGEMRHWQLGTMGCHMTIN